MTTTLPPAMFNGSLADLPGNLPFERLTGPRILQVVVTADTDISYAASELSAFRKRILPASDGIVHLTTQIDFSHRGIDAGDAFDAANMGPGSNYPVGLAVWAYVRSGASVSAVNAASFSAVPNALGAGQVASRQHHYQTVGFTRVPFAVTANVYYDFTLYMTAHTDAGSMNGVDGAAELTASGGTNRFMIEYMPGVISIE